MNNNELQLLSQEVETWPAERVVQAVGEQFRDRLLLTCSFGGGGIVLAHMLSRYHPDVPVLFLDTGFHFAETLQFKNEFADRYGIRVIDVHPRLSVAEQEARFGPALYARNPDLCCSLRKVEPLAAALLDRQVDAWMSALRREQSATRQNINVLEWHTVTDAPLTNRSRRVLKIHPLAAWTRADIQRYIVEHDLPYHPLLDQGYTSIGCAPCTRPVANGDAERSGRWAGTDKTECGLHTFTSRSNPSPSDLEEAVK